MKRRVGGALRERPTRVAAAATLIVGALYVVLAVAVVAIVQRSLVVEVDQRLATEIATTQHRADAATFVPGQDPVDTDDSRRFDAPLLVWLVTPSGSSTSNPLAPPLPAAFARVSAPTSATVAGTAVRLSGGPMPDGWLVVGESTAPIASAVGTVELAELIVAPFLLVLVFVGALIVGRRVAAPLERARRRQLDFTADASHELRTPLTVIEAETSLALGSPRDPEADRQTFVRVHDESLHLRELVGDMLWLARFDAAPRPPEAAPVDLGTLATATAQRFRAVCEQRSLTLTTGIQGPDTAVITAPPEWLVRLVGVLVDNATKYAPRGGAVAVRVVAGGGRVRLVVDDTGPGIPLEQRALIFDRFHRATDEQSGAGLGLAIADAVVRATGGRWTVGDAPGGGARLAVTWPRALAGATQHTAEVTSLPEDAKSS